MGAASNEATKTKQEAAAEVEPAGPSLTYKRTTARDLLLSLSAT